MASTKGNSEPKTTTELMRKMKADLETWIENHAPPHDSKRVRMDTFKQSVNSVRDSILQTTNGLSAIVRILRLQKNSAEANLIEIAYNELLQTVDANELLRKNPNLGTSIWFDLGGYGGPKERAKELADTLGDCANNLTSQISVKQETANEADSKNGQGAIRHISEAPVLSGQQPSKKRRKAEEKFATILAYMKKYPNATSPEVSKNTGIDQTDVRHRWGPIKKAIQKKRSMDTGSKHDGIIEAEDSSALCYSCRIPLSKSFECPICRKIITGECKTCHYTNQHPEQAIP